MTRRLSHNCRSRRARSPARIKIRVASLLLAGGIACGVAGSAASQSVLEPASRSAERVTDLWWLMFWIGTVIFVLVMLLALYAIVHGRRSTERVGLPTGRKQAVVIGGGIVMPLAVLAVVFGFTLQTLSGLAEDREDQAWTVDVVAHQFWWEVTYPGTDVITANEIHVPVREPVEFRLTSSDVIHSFWVPELYGKVDMMPGTTTSVTFTVDEPGRYRGQCAQLCGVSHANMALYIVADEPQVFGDWLAQQQEPATLPPADSIVAEGREVFLSSACVYCHTVRGPNPASAEIGPDLTHLMSRETIAAGILENNTGNLAGWILDPQHLKPGNEMPAVNLDSEELQALLAYLNSLD